METVKALVVEAPGEVTINQLTLDKLGSGNVLIKIAYSSINFKDMLALEPGGGIIRDYPMIPGIDLSGWVVASDDSKISVGQEVLVTGYGLGVNHPGGFAEYARVPADWLTPLPSGLSLKEAMVYGTAGVTAAMSVIELEQAGMSPQQEPRILLTGASGGVGSLALQFLVKAGYQNVQALIRKDYQALLVENLGASKILFASDLVSSGKPLEKQEFDYVLDTVGGEVLSRLLPKIAYGGAVTTCGNVGGLNLETTVFPFILRGIRLIGIDSVALDQKKRQKIWSLLAKEWKLSRNEAVRVVRLEDVVQVAQELKEGQHLGRTIVEIS
ncbi:YhdH/YhfP family quinone oxidoreductase [Streptococcus sp. 10F2]